jgi:hypothetical protein
MQDPTKPLRHLIRKYFTKQTEKPEPRTAETTRKSNRNRHKTPKAPSERFIWGMVTMIIALIGTLTLEAIYIITTGQAQTEILAIISGLLGSITTAFLMGKNHD